MKARRAQELGVRNLELVFAPPGLPLIHKTAEGVATTSILIRGGAGTGKTTLAVALAHAIAREEAGSVVYLTTEFVPAEVSFKATLIGLDEALVIPWNARQRAGVGSILVQHLAVLAEPESLLTSADRKRRAIDAIWELLEGAGELAAPIRAVVIDAFNLPDTGPSEAALRADFVSFVQALEARGISTILVEEAGAEAAQWLAFVVDVVIELDFHAEGETGELQRKLMCRKSRYARALPGPHDYGLDPEMQRPSVWPDLLAVASAERDLPFAVPEATRARMFMPLPSDGDFMVLGGGGLIINELDKTGTAFMNALANTPGIRLVSWQCGYLTHIETKDKHVELFAGTGPHALGRAVVQVLKDTGANTVKVQGLGTLLERKRFQEPLLHVIEALRALGVLVCVHGPSEGLRLVNALADVVVDQTHRRPVLRMQAQRVRSAAIWLVDLTRTGLFHSPRLVPKSNEENKAIVEIGAALCRANRAMEKAHGPEALEILKGLQRDPKRFPGWVSALASTFFVVALARYRAGESSVNPYISYLSAPEIAQGSLPFPSVPALKDIPPELHAPLAWTYALMGDHAQAGRACYNAYDTKASVDMALHGLWWSMNAVYALSDDSITQLGMLQEMPFGRFTLGFLLLGLAWRKRFDEVDAAAQAAGKTYGLPGYLVSRLQSEARLESSDAAVLADAKARLAAIFADEHLPILHRAEVAHNLGCACERLNEWGEAARWYRKAIDINPCLAMASEALAQFGEVDRTAPPPGGVSGEQDELLPGEQDRSAPS